MPICETLLECPKCVPINTNIQGRDIKFIENYEQGEDVMTSGKLTTISQVFTRKYKGPMTSLKAMGCLELSVTPEHPIPITQRRKQTAAYLRAWRRGEKHALYAPTDVILKSARDIQIGDFLVLPKLKQITYDINDELCYLYGLYVAEGSSCTSPRKHGNKGEVSFSFGKHETQLIETTKQLIYKFFDKEARTTNAKTATVVQFDSVAIAKTLKKQFGHGACNKKIPEFLMFSSKNNTKSFLKGYFDGDGNYSPKRRDHRASTCSPTLLIQLQKLLTKLDIFAPIGLIRKSGTDIIQGRIVKLHNQYGIRISAANNLFRTTTISRHHRQFLEDPDTFYVPVRKKKEYQYNENVYNFQTADNYYEIQNILVHNCGAQHVAPGFKDEKAGVKIRERKRKRNIEQLKAQYRLP